VTTKKPATKNAESWITQGRGERKDATPAKQEIHKSKTEDSQEKKREPAKRERFTVNLAPTLIEWARRAVVFTPGQSLSRLAEDALTRELTRLEKQRGEPFPSTTATPKKGRPVTLMG
jgi:hypothetical protein